MNIIKIFESKIGITDYDKIKKYIIFCESNNNQYDNYYESHHILPKSLFPEYVKSKENLVNLSLENHIRAHILLHEALPHIPQFAAAVNMTLGNTKLYDDVSIELAVEAKTKWRNFLLSENNPHRGSKRSPETCRRISEANKGKVISEETKIRISEYHKSGKMDEAYKKSAASRKGKPLSSNHKEKIKKSMLNVGENHHTKTEEYRKYRSDAFKNKNPSHDPVLKEKIRESQRKRYEKMSSEEKEEIGKRFSKINKGKISCYNRITKEFSRFDPNNIPDCWEDARGKTKWEHDQNGKRIKVFTIL